MRVKIIYAPPQGGDSFYEQSLYHVPTETVREIVSDFEASQKSDTQALACKTYEYALTQEENGDTEESSAAETAPQGIVALDFREIVSIEAFDPAA